MHPTVTLLDRFHHHIPVPFDIGPIGMQFHLQPRFLEYLFTSGNIFGKTDTHT